MALITAWFVSGSSSPSEVLLREPGYDRGFGRKYLAQLNPRLPVSPIADFALNRSTEAGAGEFYIGGFDGFAVVQTVLDGITDLTDIRDLIGGGIPATDLYVIGEDPATGWAAFAHWQHGVLVRNFAADHAHAYKDDGLPLSAERSFWAGEHPPVNRGPGHPLPFDPIDLARALEIDQLGFNPRDTASDIPVSAFAVDGRPEPRLSAPKPESAPEEIPLGDYDDYEAAEDYSRYDEELGDLPLLNKAQRRVRAVTSGALTGARQAKRKVRAAGRNAWSRVNRRNR